LATELHFKGDERRLDLARDALAVARQTSDPATLAEVLAAACLAAWGSTAQATQGPLADELSDLAGRLGDRTLEFHAGVAVFYSATGQGEMERADAALATCGRLAAELGQPSLGWRVTHLQMHKALAAGDLQAVESWSAEALRLGEASGQPDALPYARGALTIARLLEGRPHEAHELVGPVVEQLPRATAYQGILAWALAEDDERDEAQAVLDRLRGPDAFTGVPHDHHRPVTLCTASRACHRLGDAAVAEELYDALLPFRSNTVNGQTVWLGPATHDLGLLATVLDRYDDAEVHYADAVERQDRMGARATVVHTRLAWAEMLQRRGSAGDGLKAQRLLQEAKAAAREIGMAGVLTRIDELLC
jgi:tetratricopeptide (TPR) repeat protein